MAARSLAVGELVLGLDGCRGGWVGVLWDGASGCEVVFAETEEIPGLLDSRPDVQVAAIDIPIGTAPGAFRKVDKLAKDLLHGRCGHGRASSVFETPPTEVLHAKDHKTATALSVKLTGRGISQQAFALRKRILEVAELAKSEGDRIVEMHPEVSFSELGYPGRPQFSKRTWNGQAERRALLVGAGITLPNQIEGPAGSVPPDDVLDAAIGAWTAARVVAGTAGSLPDGAKRTERGVIWY